MNKKSFCLFFIFIVFVSNVYSALLLMQKRRVLDMDLYQLPSDNVMNMLGVRQQSVPLIEEINENSDEEYLNALNLFNCLKNSEKQFDLGCGLGLVFDFRDKNSLKFFLVHLCDIAKGLRTSVLHLLVELQSVKDLQQCIDCLEKNKEDFDFNNIDPVPNSDLTPHAHRYVTPLFYAVYLNNYEKAKTLIENGADIYVRNGFGYSLLHFAIYLNNIDLLKLIIDKFKDHIEKGERLYFNVLNDQNNKTKHTPLHFAVWRGNIQILEFLLEQKLDLCLCDNGRQTVFHILVKNYINNENYRMNAEKILKMLIKNAYRYILRKDGNNKFPRDYLDKNDSLRRVLYDSSSVRIWNMFGY